MATAQAPTRQDLNRMMVRLAITWINGNLKDVINEIVALPVPQAATLASLLTDNFRARGLRSDAQTLRNLLMRRAE